MKKILALAACFLVLVASLNAQKPKMRSIEGSVFDLNTGDSLCNVAVSIKGMKIRTTTNEKGYFKLTVPSDPKAIIEFSFEGYETQKHKLGTLKVINISLKPLKEDLESVVVIEDQLQNTYI